MKDPDLRRSKVALERLSADPDARILAEMRDRAVKSYRLDIGKARKEGRMEGRIEGIQEGRATLLSDQLSIKFGPLPPPKTASVWRRGTPDRRFRLPAAQKRSLCTPETPTIAPVCADHSAKTKRGCKTL